MEQLNTIPKGFNNNLIWNLGHVIATQQLLTYGLSGLAPVVEADLIAAFRKGTRPEGVVSQSDYDRFKELCFSMIDKTSADYSAGIFTEFKTYVSSYNVTLNSVEDAIMFNNVHEGLHLGTMMALKKLI